MDLEKGGIAWKMLGDIFALWKKYQNPIDSSEWWKIVLSEHGEFVLRYQETDYAEVAKDFSLAIIHHLERKDVKNSEKC